MKIVNATAVFENDEEEFYFEIDDHITDKEMVDKAFRIAMGMHNDFKEVIINSIENEDNKTL